TILLTTQMLSEAEEMCDRVLILDRGKVVAEGDIASLKRMSGGFYDVVLTFTSVEEPLLERLGQANPVRLEVKRNTVEMTLQGPEAGVLALLSSLAERWPILNLEVNGASLEDIFVELLGQPASSRAKPRSSPPADSAP
ncbi:MAG: hypothetical protein HY649_09515, partial [Acidobacteria bacterium]|nr:hypothetical protein [Acidobacteriota bacterium]